MRIQFKRNGIHRLRRTKRLARAAAFGLLLIAGIELHPAPNVAFASPHQGPGADGPHYLSPVTLALSPDGHRLYVVCEDSNTVLAVDTRSEQVVARVSVGQEPKAIAVSPDGSNLYVSNEDEGTISEIEASTFQVRRTLRVGWGPAGLTTDRAGRVLYVANTLGNDVWLLDLATGREIKSLAGGSFPEYLALSRDGNSVYVSNLLAMLGPFDKPPVSELTVIDTRRQQIAERIMLPGVIQLRHIAEIPSRNGGYLLVPFLRPKNLNPLVQIEQGWYLTHGMAVIRPGATQASRMDEVLLDDVDRYYADGFGAAATRDGRLALVTASGANVVSLIDTAKLNQLLQHVPSGQPEALADRLDSARQFVVRRLPTGRNPTAVAVGQDDHFAYIANRMDDTVSVVDLRKQAIAATIELGGPKPITAIRHGQRLFFDATYCFQHQMACATCHPHEGLSDGLAWSLETPELGRDVVENRTLRSISDTSPFKWNGKNPDIETQAGPRTAMYIFRSRGFTDSEVKDLATYIRSLALPTNPRLARNHNLTETQERGRRIFFRTKTNDGSIIPPQSRCYFCHPPLTHYTARVEMNVGTTTSYDTAQTFDVPQLEGVYMRAPYLHNGEALTLEEIWTKFNPDDRHGITSDMDKVQLNDLIDFLKTL